jgi:LysR family transcriptional regulator, mexEF-oprN operon transcriptional activator
MHDVDFSHGTLRRIDLNLLVAFDALIEERHVSRAAARLNIGQPAMSHALGRLREVFGDALFVRSGTHMEPTPRALELAPAIRAWLESACLFLFSERLFDPALATGTFVIAAPDGLEALLLPAVIAELRATAPGIDIRAALLEIGQELAALDRGETDLLITTAPARTREWHRSEIQLECGFVAMHSCQQLTLPPQPTLLDLAAFDHVASSHRGSTASVVDHLFADHGCARRIVATSASLTATGRILQAAPLISVQPALYLPLFAELPDIVHVPLDARLRLRVNFIWHRRNDSHPLHVFMRRVLADSIHRLRP